MTDFMIRFIICNIFISGLIILLLVLKIIFKNNLSGRMQYNLWILLLGLLATPFIPFCPISYSQIVSKFRNIRNFTMLNTKFSITTITYPQPTETTGLINDFAISVSTKVPSTIETLLFVIWTAGIVTMIILLIKSKIRLDKIRNSAMILQNTEVYQLYNLCLDEMKIKRMIPIYSTAFLKSPIIVGIFNPRIYLPIHTISDYNATDMRYMLLHELHHYKHHDSFINCLMNIAGILYWFNPLIWYSLKEMHNDKEIACDTSVLKMLDETEYEKYGNTLINFAEKISTTPFPFVSGISGNIKQMKKRISNIAYYKKPDFRKNIKCFTVFLLISTILIGFTPMLSTYAVNKNRYIWDYSKENLTYVDYSSHFGEFNGSFVLYNMNNDTWNIFDIDNATIRVSPDSTYKIYNALFGLEEGVISYDNSLITWNGINYPFAEWNKNQTLQSAMQSSVNWYFQEIDQKIGSNKINQYIHQIGYGNENINNSNFSTYWLESSLKISPVEQVKLLKNIFSNNRDFSSKNINTVKDSICLYNSAAGTFYGKTGTGRINNLDINGWFIGLIEKEDNTYFLSTNIKADKNATGSNAAKITMSILSELDIWE